MALPTDMKGHDSKKLTFWGTSPIIFALTILFAIPITIVNYYYKPIFKIGIVPYKVLIIIAFLLLVTGIPLYLKTLMVLKAAHKKQELITNGVFSICRNPLFAVVIFLLLPGILLLFNSWLLLTIPCFMFLMFKIFIIREEHLMADEFGQEYIDYKNSTSTIFPKIWKYKKGNMPPLLIRLRHLLGAGPHLILLVLLIEGLTMVIRRWTSIPVSLSFVWQVILSVPCIGICLCGTIWFNLYLNLQKVNFLDNKNELITNGPFNYVRHPLYATLLLTVPPMLIIWYADLLFFFPWVVILILAHYVVMLEERGLIKKFGEDYEKYRRFVPPLIPYKGAGGKKYRVEHKKTTRKN